MILIFYLQGKHQNLRLYENWKFAASKRKGILGSILNIFLKSRIPLKIILHVLINYIDK